MKCKKIKNNGTRCKNNAVEKKEYCRLHGGLAFDHKNINSKIDSSCSKLSKKDYLYIDLLDEKERLIYTRENLDAIYQLEEDLRLVNVRIRRYLEQINNLKGLEKQLIREIISGKYEQQTYEPIINTRIKLESDISKCQKLKSEIIHALQEARYNINDAGSSDNGFLAAMTPQNDWANYEE